MSDIEFVRLHSLTLAKAKALVQRTADEFGAEYDLSSEWHGNTLHFHRSGIDGQMFVTDSEVRLQLKLGFLLKPFKGKFVDHIERNFDKLLAEQEPRTRANKANPKDSAGREMSGKLKTVEQDPRRTGRAARRRSD